MSFGGYDLGDYELLGIPDFGGIALWRLQFWRLRALEVTVLEFLILVLSPTTVCRCIFEPNEILCTAKQFFLNRYSIPLNFKFVVVP